MVRRGILALCLLAGAAAFRRRRFQPNWSFRRSADWVISKTPTRYGDALRTIRKCMDCDALQVSLQNHSISLTNATLSLDSEEALRVERLEVVVESYSPLIVSASLGTVQVSVEAHDLLLRDTNWHRLSELEEAFTQLSLSSSSATSSTSSSSLSGVRRLDFSGVAVLQLTPNQLLGGADSRVSATLDWQHDLEPISRRIERRAEKEGSVSLIDVFTMIRTDLVLAAGGLVLARVLDAQDGERTSKSAIRVAGVEVDLLRPKATLDGLGDRFTRYVERKAAETLGLDQAELAAAAAALRRRGDGVDDDAPGSRSEL
jgi:hypothetical protein